MLKSRIINFEWKCDYNYSTPENFDKIKIKLIQKEIKQALDDGCDTIIGLHLMDGFLEPKCRYKEFIRLLNTIKTYAYGFGIKKIILISGHDDNLDNCPFDYYFLDFDLRMLINSYPEIDQLPKFNSNNSKFLFLTGNPIRPNRIGLLSKYYDTGLLSDAEWSFFSPWTPEDQIWCREHLKHYSDEKYEKFLNDCERSFDERYHTGKPYYGSYTSNDAPVIWYDVVKTDWAQLPTHIDSSVYGQTLFSVISEGPNYWAEDYDFITEKTWRTFLHQHPFIFAGHPDQFRYIKKLGFKTFEDYLLIKDYAYIDKENDRLDAIVQNTEYWLKNLKNHLEEIKKDVEYNYQLFFEYSNQQTEFLNFLHKDLNVPLEEIKYYIDVKGYVNLIRRPDGF